MRGVADGHDARPPHFAMKRLTALMLLISLLPFAAEAAPRRRAVATPTDPDEIIVSFVPLEGTRSMTQTNLDLGSVAHDGRTARSTRTTRIVQTVGVRIERKSGAATSGTASVRAYLQAPDGRCTVRVDGIAIGATSQVVDPRAAIGTTVAHRIEIEIPTSVPEGALFSAIGWEVTTN
jgi:hypothetical protein